MKLRPLINTLISTRHQNRLPLLARMTDAQQHAQIQLLPSKDLSTTHVPANQKSSFQQPNLEDGNQQPSYVLVLLTDPEHQRFMNSLRNTYFPAAINKIEAHLTLFHALPGSKLETDIIPAIEDVVQHTAPYRVKATRPFHLSKGVGLAVADDIDFPKNGDKSRNTTNELHAKLRDGWKTFLSKQDSGKLALHYTAMNKVNDQNTRERAFHELSESFRKGEDVSGARFHYTRDKDDHPGTVQGSGNVVKWKPIGRVLGLTLYEYQEDGHWVNPKEFRFRTTGPC